jgi:hypothetical protein
VELWEDLQESENRFNRQTTVKPLFL